MTVKVLPDFHIFFPPLALGVPSEITYQTKLHEIVTPMTFPAPLHANQILEN
jgi:hypothetical protein